MTTAIRKKLSAVAKRHRANWSSWAADLAHGRGEPTPGDLLEAARALGIADADAADLLEADADLIREAARCDAAVERGRLRREGMLAPWGGDVEQLRAAAKSARAEASRLETLLRDATWPAGFSFRSRRHELRKARPDLFPKEPTE